MKNHLVKEKMFGLQVYGRKVAAALYLPSTNIQRTLLMVPPLMEERKGCLPMLCDIARKLAETGTTVLRLDLSGCGDSSGRFSDYSILDWVEDIRIAYDCLIKHFPALPRYILGIRFGSFLALKAELLLDGAILIAPLTGSEFLRQLQQRNMVNQMVAYGKIQNGRSSMLENWQNGDSTDLDGYEVSARLIYDLQEAKINEATSANQPNNILAVSVGPGGGVIERNFALVEHAEKKRLNLPAFWNTVGYVDTSECVDVVVSWLNQQTSKSPRLVQAQSPKLDAEISEIFCDSETVESAVQFQTPTGSILRGVLHRPLSGAEQSSCSSFIIFLPGWSGDRTGPHRMFVHAARQYAACGFQSLRFDYMGRGDSDGQHHDANIASMVSDTKAAMQWLRKEHGVSSFILIAICSGCKVAISVAAEATDINAMALWSAESMGSLRTAATGRRKTMHALKTYARKLCQRETWNKLFKGQIQIKMVQKALIQHETRSREEARHEDEILRKFRAFNGNLFFIFGGSDPDAVGSRSAYRDFCQRHRIRFSDLVVPHAGHSYYAMDWEKRVLGETRDFIKQT